jgi:hypothetical protein
MFGYFAWNASKPCFTRASSAGVEDQPDTVRVMLPDSADEAVVLVFAGHFTSAFLGPVAPPPVPPDPVPPPHAERTATSESTAIVLKAQRDNPTPERFMIS